MNDRHNGLSLADALTALINGALIARHGWNGKGMWLIYVPGSTIGLAEGTPYAKALGPNRVITIRPHIDMWTGEGVMQPGWLASQADMFATDWYIVPVATRAA